MLEVNAQDAEQSSYQPYDREGDNVKKKYKKLLKRVKALEARVEVLDQLANGNEIIWPTSDFEPQAV